MIKVHYDNNGYIKGFYPEFINYDFIPEPYILISEEQHQEILNGRKVKILNNQLVDIEKEELRKAQDEINKKEKVEKIKQQLYELDIKSIRAMREGGQNNEGVDWTEFYTSQIYALRNELKTLEGTNE